MSERRKPPVVTLETLTETRLCAIYQTLRAWALERGAYLDDNPDMAMWTAYGEDEMGAEWRKINLWARDQIIGIMKAEEYEDG